MLEQQLNDRLQKLWIARGRRTVRTVEVGFQQNTIPVSQYLVEAANQVNGLENVFFQVSCGSHLAYEDFSVPSKWVVRNLAYSTIL
jgi:hypothetical protein